MARSTTRVISSTVSAGNTVGDLRLRDISSTAIAAAVNKAANYQMEEIRKAGRAMGVYRTGQTLASLRVAMDWTGRSATIVFTGKNSKGLPNTEVAYLNNYGTRRKYARPFVSSTKRYDEIGKIFEQELFGAE